MKVLTKIIVGSLLFLEPAKAMNEEETSNLPRIQSTQFHPPKTQSSSFIISFGYLPNMLVGYIFKFLDVNDLGRIAQVSVRWKKITENPNLWRDMGLKYYGDFLCDEYLRENPKQKVVSHYLSVSVNATENLNEIERIVSDCYEELFSKPITKLVRKDDNKEKDVVRNKVLFPSATIVASRVVSTP